MTTPHGSVRYMTRDELEGFAATLRTVGSNILDAIDTPDHAGEEQYRQAISELREALK